MIKTKNGPKNYPDELDIDMAVVSDTVASSHGGGLSDAYIGKRSTFNVVPIVAQQRLDFNQLSTMPKEYRARMEFDIRKNIAYSIAEEMLRRGLIEFQEVSTSPLSEMTVVGSAHILEEPF